MRTIFIATLFIFNCAISIAQVTFYKERELGNQLMMCNEPAIALNPNNTKHQIIATNTKHVFRSKKGGKKFKHQRAESIHGVYGDPVLLFDDLNNCYYVHLSQDKSKEWPESFDKIVVQKTSNNGKSWNDGIGIGKNGKMQDKAWISFEGNKNSPWYGNLYVTWTQFDEYESKNPKDSTRILFSKSTDRGETFSTPIIISDESGDCRDSDSTLEGATTCTGPNGEIYALWAGHQQLFLDKSLDGGKTWGKDKSILAIPEGWELDIPNFSRTNGLPFINSNKEGKLVACVAYEQNHYNRVFVIESNDKGQTWSAPLALQKEDSTHYMMPHGFLDKSSGTYGVIYYKIKNNFINVLLSYKKQNEKQFTTIRLNTYAFAIPGRNLFFGDYINVSIVDNLIAATWTETKGISTVVKTRRVKLD